jgi:hypothetical protein
LKASYEVCGGSILAHKTAKGSGTDLLAIQLYSAHLFVIFASFCADSLRAMAAPPRATALATCGFRVPGPLGDRTLPTQASCAGRPSKIAFNSGIDHKAQACARILEKQDSLQMSQVFPFSCIGDQMGFAFQGFYKRDPRTGKVIRFPHHLYVQTQIKKRTYVGRM